MAEPNREVRTTFRMSEPEKSQLDFIREPGETQSACIRRLINEKWFDLNMAFDAEQDSSEWDHCEARG